MRLLILLFTLSVMTSNLSGQDYKEKFNDLLNKKDTTNTEKILKEWKASTPNDPELYVAFFNYFGRKSMMEVLRIGDNPQGKESFKIMDTDSSKKEPVGYLYDDIIYNPDVLKIGYDYIDTGIIKFPTRLDMRFGKMYLLKENNDFESLTGEIIKAIEYSDVIKNKWTWTNNKAVEKPLDFFLGNLQNYIIVLYNEGEKQVDNMKLISETVIKYYPDNVVYLSNLATCYVLKNDNDKALELFLKAEEKAPKDFIVLNDIALIYEQKNEKEKAIKYYNKVVKYGNSEAKEFAKNKLDILKKK
jgi:tetratricopeptide (TPR) repeat protein